MWNVPYSLHIRSQSEKASVEVTREKKEKA